MNEVICLDDRYSTTRRVRKVMPEVRLEEIKVEQKSEDQYATILFLPEGEDRQDEGGLRTRGYFKKQEAEKPLITIVTVVFNNEAHLEGTILSVINQMYDNVEYIVIDGGSTDGTVDIIRKYEHAIDYWVSEKDNGIYNAMNKGINAAKGVFINFLNSGDRLINQGVLSSIDFKGNFLCVYGRAQNKTRECNIPNHQAMFILRDWHVKNKYNTDYRICADYEIKLKLNNAQKNKFVDMEIVFSQPGGLSQTLDYCNAYLVNAWDIYRIEKKYSKRNLLIIIITMAARWLYSRIRCFGKFL